MNWKQTGMPTALVSRLGQMRAEPGGRELVEMVRELTASLANAERELESANRRYERLTADLARRGISIEEPGEEASEKPRPREPESILEGIDEWEEWDRKFRALLG